MSSAVVLSKITKDDLPFTPYLQKNSPKLYNLNLCKLDVFKEMKAMNFCMNVNFLNSLGSHVAPPYFVGVGFSLLPASYH